MAKAATADQGALDAPKQSKKLLIIIVAAVVLIAAAGGAFFMSSKKKHAEEAEDAEEGAKPAKTARHAPQAKPGAPPVFVNLDPFTVNLTPENGEQYLQVIAVLKVADAKIGDEIKVYMPELRHRVLMLLTSKKASEISGAEGRAALAEALRSEANEMLGYTPSQPKKKAPAGEEGQGKRPIVDGPVLAVLFTSFIVQ